MTTEDRRAHDPWAPAPTALLGVVAPPDAELPPADDAPDDDLDELRKPELVELAEQRGVDATGTKTDIIARLRAPQ